MFKKIPRGKKKAWQTEIARERIVILFKEAEKRFKDKPDLSDRYVKIARNIGMKFNVSIPKELKRRFCKKCLSFLVYGKNARQRINSEKKYVLITCIKCGHKQRIPYAKKANKEKQKLL